VAVVILHVQNMKLVTTEFKSGGLHEKHVVATWSVWNHLSICLISKPSVYPFCYALAPEKYHQQHNFRAYSHHCLWTDSRARYRLVRRWQYRQHNSYRLHLACFITTTAIWRHHQQLTTHTLTNQTHYVRYTINLHKLTKPFGKSYSK